MNKNGRDMDETLARNRNNAISDSDGKIRTKKYR